MAEQRHTLEDLKRLRDEVQVRMHLGEMEVKDWWARVEPKFAELEASMVREGERVIESADVFIDEIAEALRRVRDRLGTDS